MRGAAKSAVPYWARGGARSWDSVNACKMFVPFNSASVREEVSGAVFVPESGSVAYDAGSRSCVLSTSSMDFRTATELLPIDAGATSLFMMAGFISMGADDPAVNGPAMMFGKVLESIVDEFGDPYLDWTVWDSPNNGRIRIQNSRAGVNGNAKTSIFNYACLRDYNSAGYAGAYRPNLIEASVGVGGYFVEYCLYTPDGSYPESACFNLGSGVEIYSRTGNHINDVVGAVNIRKTLNIENLSPTGWLRLDFQETPPANYVELVKLQAAEWARGNKVVLPYWDQ